MGGSPYKIDGPTCLSFSGGRTSAYMLRRTLDANDGLPPDSVVCFANTGKEEEETLRFVKECGERWSVPILWVEYRAEDPGYALVDFSTASRNGEPFETIIRERQYLPNPVTRFCTVELKIRAMHKHLKSLGWDEWDQFVGIRADEHRRVAKIRARGHSSETTRETMCLPLADDGITSAHIQEFWASQPFQLDLPTYKGRTLAGNCDLCFLKSAGQVASLIEERPSRAAWWASMEALHLSSKPEGAVFRSDRPSYAEMLRFANTQIPLFRFDDIDDEPIDCMCGD